MNVFDFVTCFGAKDFMQIFIFYYIFPFINVKNIFYIYYLHTLQCVLNRQKRKTTNTYEISTAICLDLFCY
jgi:hypothetical protein